MKGTSCTHPLVNTNYLANDIFSQEEILFLKEELEHKQKTINELFNILHNKNNEKQLEKNKYSEKNYQEKF